MKLSKTLLSAILIGMAVQTLPSCKKEKDKPNTKAPATQNPTTSGNCPACGMG